MRHLALPAPTEPFWWGLPYWLVGVILMIALFAVFQVYYWVGRRLGEKLYEARVGERIGRDRVARIERAGEKWGALAGYGCVWVAVLRLTLPGGAGGRVGSRRLEVGAGARVCMTWAPLWWSGGMVAIWAWLRLAAQPPLTAALVAVAVVAAIAAYVARRRRKRAEREEELAS